MPETLRTNPGQAQGGRRSGGLQSRLKSYLSSGRVGAFLIKLLALYSAIVVALVSSVILLGSNQPRERAIIMMALGLILLWCVLGGLLTLKLRERIRNLVLRIPLGWKLKFVLFATLLALIEEAIATTMTNAAPLFGVTPEEAHITASANYLHVVLFHSVIVFIPGYIAWQYLLSRYDFTPNQVFLLYGFLGSTAEAWINPSSFFGGFWFFVYGLMIYLPAYSLPPRPEARKPKPIHYILTWALPTVSAIPLVIVVVLVRQWLQIPLFPGT